MERTIKASLALLGSGTLMAAKRWDQVGKQPPKISLAQWSLHRAFQKGDLNADNFAGIARDDYQISAVEYVNAFYKNYPLKMKFSGTK